MLVALKNESQFLHMLSLKSAKKKKLRTMFWPVLLLEYLKTEMLNIVRFHQNIAQTDDNKEFLAL